MGKDIDKQKIVSVGKTSAPHIQEMINISQELLLSMKDGIVQTEEGRKKVMELRNKWRITHMDVLQHTQDPLLQQIDPGTCMQNISLLENFVDCIQKGSISLKDGKNMFSGSDDIDQRHNQKLFLIKKELYKMGVLTDEDSRITVDNYEEIALKFTEKILTEDAFEEIYQEVNALLKAGQFVLINEKSFDPQDRGYRFLKLINNTLKRSQYYKDPVLYLQMSVKKESSLPKKEVPCRSQKIIAVQLEQPIIKEQELVEKKTFTITIQRSPEEQKLFQLLKIFAIKDIVPLKEYTKILEAIQRKEFSYKQLESYATSVKEFITTIPNENSFADIKTFTESLLETVNEYKEDTQEMKKQREEEEDKSKLQEEKKIYKQAYYKKSLHHIYDWVDNIHHQIERALITKKEFDDTLVQVFGKILVQKQSKQSGSKKYEEFDNEKGGLQEDSIPGIQSKPLNKQERHESYDREINNEYEDLQKIYANLSEERFVLGLTKGYLLADIYEFFSKKIDEGYLTWEVLPASIVDEVKKYREVN